MAAEATEELVRGRYRIVGKLGEGSQGTTFDGVDETTGSPVAIKRFVVKGSKSWKDVELAEREATVLASLSHPSLPAHVDHFEENGALYLVMQKIEGESVAALAKRGGMLSQADVVQFLSDSAGVLDYLHRRSPPVIHRDINPKNVIRRPDGSFALVDFGAVRDKLKPEGGSTVVGTFGYMAPEQFQGRAINASDVYSVGATALRMLTGTEPENLPHKGLAIDVGAALGRGADPGLTEVLARMLDPDPDRRATSITPLLPKIRRAAARGPASTNKQERREDDRRSGSSRVYTRDRTRDRWDDDAYEEAKERAREAREEAHWAAEEARGEARRAAEQARGDARRAAREARNLARQMRRRYRRGRGGRPFHMPFFIPAALAINLAMLVVTIVLGAVVPFVLMLLSILFGKSLRDAARSVREAGRQTRSALANAQAFMTGEPVTSDHVEPHDEQPRMRVDPSDGTARPPRTRVADRADDEVIDTVATEVLDEDRTNRR